MSNVFEAAAPRHEEVYQRARGRGDIEAMARAMLGAGDEGRGAAASALREARLSHLLSLISSDTVLALRLRMRLAAERDGREGGHAAIESVLGEVLRTADLDARAEALNLAHQVLLGPDHGVRRRLITAELTKQGARTGRHQDVLLGALRRTVDAFLGADPHAERHLVEIHDQLHESGYPGARHTSDAMEVMLAIRAGRLDDARRLAETCGRTATAVGLADARSWHTTQLLAIRWYQGRVAEMVPLVREILHSPLLSPVDNGQFAALAVAAAAGGDELLARGALARLCRDDLAELPRSETWLVTLNGVVEAAHLLRDGALSARAYELLAPYAHLPMTAGPGVACFGSVHHALGVAALTTGDFELAVTHFGEAIHRNLALGHWPAVALSRYRYAQALAGRGRSGDATEARAVRAAAVEEAARIGVALPEVDTTALGTLRCVRRGRGWELILGNRRVTVGHSVGMTHLAVLIANPDIEIPAVDLLAGVRGVSARTGADQPLLDPQSLQRYRGRLAELDAADDSGHAGSVEREAERRWLLAELGSALGLSGRPRAFTDNAERARLAVTKAVRRALDRVEERDSVIGAYLRGRVRTGARCCFGWGP